MKLRVRADMLPKRCDHIEVAEFVLGKLYWSQTKKLKQKRMIEKKKNKMSNEGVKLEKRKKFILKS